MCQLSATVFLLVSFCYPRLRTCLLILMGKEGKEEEIHQCKIETWAAHLLLVPWPGTEPTTQTCALAENCPGLFGLWDDTTTNCTTAAGKTHLSSSPFRVADTVFICYLTPTLWAWTAGRHHVISVGPWNGLCSLTESLLPIKEQD